MWDMLAGAICLGLMWYYDSWKLAVLAIFIALGAIWAQGERGGSS